MTIWKFFKQPKGCPPVDPGDSKFFRSQNPLDALIRESIQNSLDAVEDDKPCVVHFRYVELPMKDCLFLDLDNLDEHIRQSGLVTRPKRQSVPFLVIEDFNCTGLPKRFLHQGQEIDKQDKFFSSGMTDKGAGKGGSHGKGKIALSNFSSIQTFLIYSNFQNNGSSKRQNLVRGWSVLNVHEISKVRYMPYGSLDLSVDDLPENLFQRSLDNSESGLSVAIPYPRLEDEDVKPAELATELQKRIIKYCYMPIISKRLRLEIEVLTGRNTNAPFNIDYNTINDVAMDDSEKIHIDVLENASQGKLLQIEKTIPGDVWRKPVPDLPSNVKQAITAIKHSSQDLVCNISFEVKAKKSLSAIEIIIHSKTDVADKAHFWRQDVLISDVGSKIQDFLVIATVQNKLSDFLRLLEDPGHTNWSTGDIRNLSYFDMSKLEIQKLVRYIKNLPNLITQQLSKQISERDSATLFKKFFPHPRLGTVSPPDPGPKSPKTSQSRYFEIEGADLGFSVKPLQRKSLPREDVTIKVAYDNGDGYDSSFNEYQKNDFNFTKNDITIQCYGADIKSRQPQQIVLHHLSDEFRIHFTGFNLQDRELVVEVLP